MPNCRSVLRRRWSCCPAEGFEWPLKLFVHPFSATIHALRDRQELIPPLACPDKISLTNAFTFDDAKITQGHERIATATAISGSIHHHLRHPKSWDVK
jgi:hypothetical protein